MGHYENFTKMTRPDMFMGTYWELKPCLLKALVLSTCTIDTKIWGSYLKNSHWKILKANMMSPIEVRPLTTYHLQLAKFGECPMKLYACKLIIGFQ